MRDAERTERVIKRMEMDYLPDSAVAREDRMLNAIEHIAFHVGRINKKLSEIERDLVTIATRT